MFWTLENAKGQFYIGHTYLENRISSHNRTEKLGKFTKWSWRLVGQRHADRAIAMRRELEIKSWKSARLIRERLIKLNM